MYFYSPGCKKRGQDLSRQTEDVYKIVPPYATDLETGEVINKSSQPKLVLTGKLNVAKKIQEFASDVDLYAILDRVLASGDESLLNRRIGTFADIVDIPNNLNDYNAYMAAQESKIKKMPKDIGLEIVKGKTDTPTIQAMIDESVKKQLLAAQAAQEVMSKESEVK